MTVFKPSTLRPITEMSYPHTPSATPEQPCIYCTRELIALANRVDHMKHYNDALDIEFQEMTKLIDSVNEKFSPCLFFGPSLTSQLDELSTVVINKGHQLDTAEQQTGRAAKAGTHNTDSLVALEENV